MPSTERPILRGVRSLFDTQDGKNFIDIHSDVVINVGFAIMHNGPKNHLYLGWIVRFFIVTIKILKSLRIRAGVPECEFGMALTISGEGPVTICDFSHHGMTDLGALTNSAFPRMSFGIDSDVNAILTTFCTDVCDRIGARFPQAREIVYLP